LLNPSTPVLWAVGAVFVLVIGGLAGVVGTGVGKHHALHDTYYVVVHAHSAPTLAAVFGVFAGLYYVLPRVARYAYSDFLGKAHFLLWLIGATVSVIVVPMGLALRAGHDPNALRFWNLMSSISTYSLAAGILTFFANIIFSFLRRRTGG
jgi:cytochrome c oxidase subunit 1